MSTRLEDYDFVLPPELIAQQPVEPRDHSKLLHLPRAGGSVRHRIFLELPELLEPSDVIVVNNSRVIPARLLGRRILVDAAGKRSPGGNVEFLLLERALGAPHRWEGLFKSSARPAPGFEFEIPTPSGEPLRGTITRTGGAPGAAHTGSLEAEFDRDPVESGAGELPLPPYIDRPDPAAATNYQTIYNREAGSAAAPTAGLHFTESVRDRLTKRGIGWEEITLHVGLGTFRPVKTTDIREHAMHEERYSISDETAERLTRAVAEGRRIIAVGTTTVRTLESAWDPDARRFRAGMQRTSIFIYPGAPGRPEGKALHVVGGLLTNFHLPKSTLLMLVSAFAGRERILGAYAEAVKQRYRFFSYGDAMLIV